MIKLNGIPVNTTIFPDNTSQVWNIDNDILEQTNFSLVTWEFSNEGEFLQLAQLKMLLASKGIRCNLKLPFLPYGRQDKPVANDTTFGLRSFAKLLNSLGFQEITIIDPHSELALELIYNSKAEYPKEQVLCLFNEHNHDLLCYPDKGAVSKYTNIYNCSYMYGEKIRDQLSGTIISYEIKGQSVAGKKVLIVDDICDGGMTFKLLTKKLLEAGAAEVNLFVTHGIFSKGLRTLKESGIKRVYTKDGEASEFQNQIAYRRL